MKLAEIFNDNMVLQRNKPIRIFGIGKGNIKIDFLNKTTEFEAESEKWCFELPAVQAGGPYILTVYLNDECKIINNVWIGDVWLAAGQSNMEMRLNEAIHTKDDIFHNPSINFFRIGVENEGDRRWISTAKDDYMDFSAIGCFFSFMMQREYNIPIGIISCNKGASCIESWIDKDVILGTDLELSPEKRHGDATIYELNDYGDLHSMLIETFTPFSLAGVLWYQGESNVGANDGAIYSKLLKCLINNWRDEFKEKLPFIIVQLAAYENVTYDTDDWALVRQQQLIASKEIENVAMVSITDLGERENIHPLRKKEVAQRLFLAAKNLVLGEKVEYSGPIVNKVEFMGNDAIVHFTHDEGLYCDGEINDLFVLNESSELKKATAKIKDNKLYIYSDSEIYGIKCCYRNYPEVNLFNKFSLPASPFIVYMR